MHETKAQKTISSALTIRLVAAIILISVSSLMIVVYLISVSAEAQYTEKAEEITGNMQSTILLPLWNYEMDGIANVARTFLQNNMVEHIRVTDESGIELFNGRALTSDSIDLTRKVRISFETHLIGYLEIGYVFKQYRENRAKNIAAGIATIIGAVLATLLMIRGTLQHCLEGPFSKLFKRMDEISAGEYKHEELDTEFKEIEAILTRFNSMADKIQAREQALEASKSRLTAILNSLHAGVILIDAETRTIVEMNPAAEKMLGATFNEVVGHRCTRYFCTQEGGQCPILDRDELEDDAPKEMTRYDGTKSHVLKAAVRLNLDGKEHLLESMLDLSDLLEAEEKNRQLLNQLAQSQKMEAIGTLSGGIAHDFNNTLTPILGYVELLELGEMTGEQRKFLSRIMAAALHAKALVQQILTFSRKSEPTKSIFELQPVVNEVLALLKSTLPSTITVTTDIPARPLYVEANSSQMHQLVMNLCTNAFHAMEADGGMLSVSIEELSITGKDLGQKHELLAGDYIKFEVKDNGSGIEKDLLDKIFEPFFTTKTVGKGTGMGLSVVHGIVTNLGGKITVNSAPHEGTSFQVLIPQAKELLESQRIYGGRSPCGSENVLLIDDDKTIIHVLGDNMEALGYRVTSYTDSEKAWLALEKDHHEFDIVITDFMMPRLNGRQLIKKIRDLSPLMPVIITSGYGIPSGIKGEEDNSNTLFIPKPIDISSLAKSIRKLIDT